MKINTVGSTSIVVIEDVFEEEENKRIFSELCDLVKQKKLLVPEKTGSARYDDGSLKKKNSAVFLDDLYGPDERYFSAILRYTEEKLLSYEMKNKLQSYNNFYGILKSANNHFTLVNYYENSDYYDFHADLCAFSILSFFFEEPKNFSGGNVVFRVNDEEFEVEIKNNMSVFFPSFYEHKVIPIKMNNEGADDSVLGRFSIAQFIFVIPRQH